MANQDQEENLALKFRRGQPNLLADPTHTAGLEIISITKSDYKKPPPKEKPMRAKKEMAFEQFLFQDMSEKVAGEVYKPRSPTNYRTTTADTYSVEGFDAKPPLCPNVCNLDFPVNRDSAVTYWSENKAVVQGVSSRKPSVPTFPMCREISKRLPERLSQHHDN